ncbi:hypothetical protein HN836_01765 [Candidatus Woesearchaeota archaeon]|nr:hypothetical protein [Candidatus Woesearchaeota archaeon]
MVHLKETRIEMLDKLLPRNFKVYSRMPDTGVTSLFGSHSNYSQCFGKMTYNIFIASLKENDRPPICLLPCKIKGESDYKTLKTIISDHILNADSLDGLFYDKEKTQQIEFNKYLLASSYGDVGAFFGFDRLVKGKYFLTNALLDILKVISSTRTNKKLGLLLKKNDIYKVKIPSVYKPEDVFFHKDACDDVVDWLDVSNISYYDNFSFKHKGILIRENRDFHFVNVSDGTQLDVAKKYIESELIQQEYKSGIRPVLNGKKINLKSIIIASPFSIDGHIIDDDLSYLGGVEKTRTAQEARDQKMPEQEFLKTFYFSRLPFYLGCKQSPPINFLLSTENSPRIKLDKFPYLSEQRFFGIEQKHVYRPLAPSSF